MMEVKVAFEQVDLELMLHKIIAVHPINMFLTCACIRLLHFIKRQIKMEKETYKVIAKVVIR